MRTRATSGGSGPSWSGQAPRSGAAVSRPRPSRRSTSRCGTSRRVVPASRWPSCSVRTPTACAATTPPAASCTRRSRRCSRTRPPRWRRASPASRSRSASPTGARTYDGWRRCGATSATTYPLMVDVNQQWDRPTAMRMGRIFDELDLEWIEEPLDAYDVEGHAHLTRTLSSPIATGEMLTSVREHLDLVEGRAVDVLQPDAARVGGITEFQRAGHGRRAATAPARSALRDGAAPAPCRGVPARHLGRALRLARAAVRGAVVTADGRMLVPDRPGLGLTLSEQARRWTTDTVTLGT